MPARLAKAWLIGLGLIIAPALAWSAVHPGRVEFEIFREGHHFGRQAVTVSEESGQLAAKVQADLRAALGPVTLFSYSQRCNEIWREGTLVNLSCATRQNGRGLSVQAHLAGDKLEVRGASGPASFPAGVLPTSWWTRPPLTTSLMVNSQNGARLPVRVSLLGRDTLQIQGQRITADHIRVQGTLAVDLWYDAQGHWVSCAFAMLGQHFTYRLLTPPSEGPA